jgi:enoyl-CoA hydratase/carnithine racemase
MSASLVEWEIKDRIAEVRLNNPPLNALDVPTKLALAEAFDQLSEKRDEIRVVILSGAGEKAFAAGADIKAFPDLEPESARQRLQRSHAIYSKVEEFHWPVIAAIHGYCLGGGLELALCCDVRYASKEAKFGFPEVGLSIFPGNGGTGRCLYCLGLGRFKEMVYSGEIVDAQTAAGYGLVEKVVPSGRVMEAAWELALKIAAKGPQGVAAAKRVINRTRDLPLAEALKVETEGWAALTSTEDMKEGARAFLEKRDPIYRNR